MAQVIRITEELQQLPVKNIAHVGEEGARRAVAVLPDGQEIPVYNHPENGTIWHEQMSIEDWRASQVQEQAELAPMQSVDLRTDGSVWIHDNETAQDIKLNALAATRLYDFLLLHMSRLQEIAQGQKVAEYNREMDERNRINAANREKPWLPLHDGE